MVVHRGTRRTLPVLTGEPMCSSNASFATSLSISLRERCILSRETEMADRAGDRAGQQLGNYRLLRLLGRGGFAEVYLGEHVYLKSLAALKVLQASLNDEDMQGFVKEA